MKRIKEWFLSSGLFILFGAMMVSSAQRFHGKKLRFWQLPMMLIAVLNAPLLFFVMGSSRPWVRPLRRFLMRQIIRAEQKSAERGIVKNTNDVSMRVRYELMERSPWDDVVPLIRAQTALYPQVKACVGFAKVYVLDGRLQEAQVAAALGMQIADEWVQANPEKAREALDKRTSRVEPQSEVASLPEDEGWKEVSKGWNNVRDRIVEGWQTSQTLDKIDGGVMAQWHSAHLAVALLEEVEKRRDKGQLTWPLPVEPDDQQSVGFAQYPFDRPFAKRIGLKNKQFDSLLRRVTKLDV